MDDTVRQQVILTLLLVGCWFLRAEGIVFLIAVSFLSFWLAYIHSMIVGMWAHLDLLKTAAEKNPKPLIWVGKNQKMCSGCNLLPQKLEGKDRICIIIIITTFFLRG